MTAAVFDEIADDESAAGTNPALLRPGTLVYLWAPGEVPHLHPGVGMVAPHMPTLARVERSTVDTIIGVDLRDGVRAKYDVARDIANPAALRWTWQVAAPPRTRTVSSNGIERIDASTLDIEQRVKLICGGVGTPLLVRLKNGDAIRGALTRLIMANPEDREAEWVVFAGDRDAAGPIAHVVRSDQIAGFSRDPDA